MREIRLRPAIADHDFKVKVKSIRRLLEKDSVKVSVFFKGREHSHPERGTALLDRVIQDTKDIAVVSKRVEKDNCFLILVRSGGELVFKKLS